MNLRRFYLLSAVSLVVMVAGAACRMFGVRTPWTLSSERSWDRTHRLVGRLFVVTGLLMIALTGILWLAMGVMLVMLVVTLVVTLVGGSWYSTRQWQADPDHRPTGSAA